MTWINGRKLNEDWDDIKFWYFDSIPPNADMTQEELLELELIRRKLARNNAR